MPNYYQGKYKAMPEMGMTKIDEGYRCTARLYSYPGPMKEIDRIWIEKPTYEEAYKAGCDWIAQQMPSHIDKEKEKAMKGK